MTIMKILKNILTAMALVITAAGLTSCYVRFSDDAKRQLKYDMRYRLSETGGKIDTVTYDCGEFHSIDIDNGISDAMFIQTGSEYKVTVISYDVMIDSIMVTNENGGLRIGYTDKTRKIYGDSQILVYSPSLSSVQSKGGCDIRFSGFTGDSLTIKTLGSGDVKAYDLSVAGRLTIVGTGSGDHKLKDISAGEMVIDKKGSGDGDYRDLDVGTLSVTSTGSGDATLSGKAGSVTLLKAGSGDIDASELKASHVSTEKSGSGDLTINRESVK